MTDSRKQKFDDYTKDRVQSFLSALLDEVPELKTVTVVFQWDFQDVTNLPQGMIVPRGEKLVLTDLPRIVAGLNTLGANLAERFLHKLVQVTKTAVEQEEEPTEEDPQASQ